MRVEFFSVFDMAAERYIDPFPAPTIQVAIRGFQEACQTENHQFTKFPEDYALYHVGSFDPEMGLFEPCPAKKIAMASSFMNSVPNLEVPK